MLFLACCFASAKSSAVLCVLFSQLKFKLLEGKGNDSYLFLLIVLAHGAPQRVLNITGFECM